jgi:hypothetical protein
MNSPSLDHLMEPQVHFSLQTLLGEEKKNRIYKSISLEL